MTDKRLGHELPANVTETRALLNRCNTKSPKLEDLATLRAMLTTTDEAWRLAGDLTKHARDKMLSATFDHAEVRMSVDIGAEKMAAELAGPDAPLLERLIAQQAALCWVQLSITQMLHADRSAEGVTFAQGEYLDRRMTAAHRRYMQALEALARVRRLLRPHAVQVNVGAQQVNVMQPGGAPQKPLGAP